MNKKNRITIISNLPIEAFIKKSLLKKHKDFNLEFSLDFVSYDEYFSYDYNNTDIVISLINFDSLCPDILNKVYSKDRCPNDIEHEIIKNISIYIHHISNGKFKLNLFFLFEDYYLYDSIYFGNSTIQYLVDSINQKLIDLYCQDIVFINTKKLISNIGINKSYNTRFKYMFGMPYSKELFEVISLEILQQILIYNGISKKCIVVDCDNVLWGGIVSEDGIDKIILSETGIGRKYQEIQNLLVSLYYNGVTIAICSKNDLEDVLNVFQNHSSMILKTNYVSLFKVNWEPKDKNIYDISKELNIGLDSIVFVDDSPYEIELVKQSLPKVISILYDKDFSFHKLHLLFNLKRVHDFREIEKRTNTYRTNHLRTSLERTCTTHQDYIKKLNIHVDIHNASDSELCRISELTQRTNKFTNGKRYTVDELKENKSHSEQKLFSVFVSDRFSDLGLVGTFEIYSDCLTLFALSCRSLGREVEHQMALFITNNFNIKRIIISNTPKNMDIFNFFKESFPKVFIEEQ